MNKIIILISALLVFSFSQAQVFKKVEKVITSTTTKYTQEEAGKAIKEALSKGITQAVNITSLTDGYFKNTEIKIPFPKDAALVKTKLTQLGLKKQVDNVELTLNRAAEKAAKEAAPIFLEAIKGLSLTDAINIVQGSNNAATNFLNNKTNQQLIAKFKPIIEKALKDVNATKYWNTAFTSYNKIPGIKKVNPNITDYATEQAIKGLFIMVAKEEVKIRANAKSYSSDILTKVFGK